MIGDKIPKVTWIVGNRTEKRPLYTLHSKEEEKSEQERISRNYDLSYWYGTGCEKCCGVYPKFYTDQDFSAYGYYVCMVCGKESTHHPMTWQAKDAWNKHEYKFSPEPYQTTIWNFLSKE